MTAAAVELRRLASEGALDEGAVEAVLEAAGHGEPRATTRRQHPAGLSDREVEVLNLAARGLTTKTIAAELYISPKTADHHIQHVYTKIGVSTRAAAALWAMQTRARSLTGSGSGCAPRDEDLRLASAPWHPRGHSRSWSDDRRPTRETAL